IGLKKLTVLSKFFDSGMEPDALRNFDRRNKTRYIPAPLCSRAALISTPLRPWPTMSGGCP
ncbi:MAG: hypothetical protein WBZ19_19445, partial [Chthoniobacterales bacterium]